MTWLSASISVLALSTSVKAHGGVTNFAIGDVKYTGRHPFLLEEDQPESPQRRWWPDPIQAVDHPYLACNRGNPLATRNPSLHAPIEAGSNFTVWHNRWQECPPDEYPKPSEPSTPWTNEPTPPFNCQPAGYNWPHGRGPVTVYMAACNGSCEDFEPEGEDVWFKIWEDGFHQGWTNTTWGNEKWYIANGAGWSSGPLTRDDEGWSVQIPKDLLPGNYLIRHEMINIELAPPQIYPSCVQLSVSGTGTKLPSEEYIVSFPGAYSDEDPGLWIAGKIYTIEGRYMENYTIPGPKVWKGDD